MESTPSGLWLQRRTDWWCKAELPITAKSIPLIAAQSTTQIRDNFEFAGLSLVCADPGSDRYADFRCDYELWDCENGIFLYLACNMESEVFSLPEVRAALTFAIDRDTIAEDFYRGFARTATLPASPLFPYYSKTLADQYGYDGAKFAQAVADAQQQNAPVVLLVNREDTLRLRVARRIADMLTQGGLAVTTSELTGQAYQKALRNKEYYLYLGQTKLSPNMDLSAFFASNGALSYGGINDIATYALCQESLANHGNYYTLHRSVMENGLLCPILFRSYAVYTTRGLISALEPSRDNVFYYSLGRTMDDAMEN
jgi:ABC-type transport system substrate-binding protein